MAVFYLKCYETDKMWSNNDVFNYGMSILCGKNFDICVFDFLRLCSNVSFEIGRYE